MDEQPSPSSSIANSETHGLDPRFIQLQRITGSIFAAIVTAGSFVGLVVLLFVADETPGWVRAVLPFLFLALTTLLAWHAYHWPVVDYRHTSYRVDKQAIEIRRGVYWRVVINIPRSRVQHTDVSQGPLERRYGLGTLVIYTAGTDHAKVDLAGLEHGVATRIREHLLPGGTGDAV
jgi:membrane protein YdbS with pleckstrin-like domain